AVKLKHLAHKPVVIYDVRDPYSQNIKDYIGGKTILKPLINIFANYIDSWEKKCAKNYDFIITNEENVRDIFTKIISPKKVDIIYNYTYLHKLRKEMPKYYDLVYCGGITEYRGAFQIIQAVKILKEDFPNIKMIFLGNFFTTKFKEKMKREIEVNGLKENIILKDSVPYHEVAEYYNKSKIGLGIFLPIRTHEIILQIKIFEYMAMGVPIVGSNFGHINNYILKDNVGLTVDPTNSKKIANAIKKLLTDKSLYNRLSENGVEAVHENYHWGIMEQKLFSIYDQLLLERDKLLIHG
ncbi:MAG: glycosyltransferase, partial [Flavobacteriaceae bacterium]|nr:glycosyltransferase [Flavobacteriaceae bacterium]